MKRGNKGYTLVELVVVLAILSIVSVAGFSIVGYLTGTKAKSAAYNIQSGLGKARIETMSKSRGKDDLGDIFFSITLNGNKEYYMELHNNRSGYEAKELIGNSGNLVISASGPSRTDTLHVSDSPSVGDISELKFYFDRSTGGLAKGINEYDTIKIVQGGVTYQINISSLTGKVTLERVFKSSDTESSDTE